MTEDLVSIIIPAYNHEKYIVETLESVINQTYKNIELIILDDGSKDNTRVMINNMDSKLKDRFSRYIFVNKKNEGICKTLNEGLTLSKGKYIIPFSSDDVMLPNRVEKQVNFFKDHEDYGLVYTDGYVVISDEKLDLNKVYPEWGRFSNIINFAEGSQLEWMLKNVFMLPTPTTCITRQCYNVVGNYDENMAFEDPDMHIRIAMKFKIGYIKEVLTLKRAHNCNTSKNIELAIALGIAMYEKYTKEPNLTNDQKDILLGTFRNFYKK